MSYTNDNHIFTIADAIEQSSNREEPTRWMNWN